MVLSIRRMEFRTGPTSATGGAIVQTINLLDADRDPIDNRITFAY